MVFVPIVVITAVFNAIVVEFLYIPSSRALQRAPAAKNIGKGT